MRLLSVEHVCDLLQVALALAIRKNGQMKANAAFREESQFMTKKQGAKHKVAVNKEFYHRFVRLFKVIVPGPFTAEVGFAALVALLLAARTSFDILLLQIFTSIERAMYAKMLV